MSEEIKATQENTKETKKGFAELKQALIEQNKKDAQRAVADFRKQQIADKKSVEKINRQLKTELEQAQELKRISNNLQKANFATPEEKEAAAKRAQIAKEAVTQTLEERKILRVTRDTRKIQQDTRSDARKSLDLEKNSLSALQKQIEDAGGVAEDSLEFRRAQNRIRRQELAIRKSEATSPAARKEIRKEQRKELFNAFKLAIAPVSERLGGLVNIFKGIGSIGTGVPGLSLGRLAFLAAIPFIIKFLDSDTFKNIKEVIIPNAVKALNFLKNRILIPLGGLIKTGFTNAFQFIKDNQETINAGLEIVGNIASFLATNLVKGFRFMFSSLADLFFGREVEDDVGGTFRTGKGLFGIVGGLIKEVREKGFLGFIKEKFRNMVNAIKEFFDDLFSLETLANVYDNIKKSLTFLPDNPFRSLIKSRERPRKDDLMGREEVKGLPTEKVVGEIIEGVAASNLGISAGTSEVTGLPKTGEEIFNDFVKNLNSADKLLEQSRAISNLATPGEITSFLRLEKMQMDLQKFSNPMNLDMGAKVESDFSKVITITPMDKFIGEGGGAFMVTQNNVNAPTQKIESNHPQYVTDQDNFLSHATSSVGGFHHR